MTSFQVRTRYDRLYETTRRAAVGWSTIRLSVSLHLVMHRGTEGEEWWGAIDALTDLLGKIASPHWRDELGEGAE
jgi:hypothetical protein